MKTLVLTLSVSILLSSSLLANELSWVDEQVQAIKPTRSGMSSRSLLLITSPFVFLEKNKTIKSEKLLPGTSRPIVSAKRQSQSTKTSSIQNNINTQNNVRVVNKLLSLGMIMNNSVLINGEWYKVGESVSGYKIRKINYNSVLLIKNSKKLLLSTKSDSKKLKFQK